MNIEKGSRIRATLPLDGDEQRLVGYVSQNNLDRESPSITLILDGESGTWTLRTEKGWRFEVIAPVEPIAGSAVTGYDVNFLQDDLWVRAPGGWVRVRGRGGSFGGGEGAHAKPVSWGELLRRYGSLTTVFDASTVGR